VTQGQTLIDFHTCTSQLWQLYRGDVIANFLFFSLQEDLSIEYAKITVKFDDLGEGRARISFKIWLQKNDFGEIPELFLLVSNRGKTCNLDKVDEDYNRYLAEEAFREAAGIEDTEIIREYNDCVLRKIVKFKQNEQLFVGRTILNPKKIKAGKARPDMFPEEISREILRNDILFVIRPATEEVASQIRNLDEKTNLIEFQFRIFIRDFLDQETLKSWNSSSESWAVNIDIHKERDLKYFPENFGKYHKYPKYLDLWINIPHNHLFIASSPVYRNAIRLEKEDIGYKTYEKEKGKKREFYEQWETRKGDYSVKISNNSGKPEEFSIVCTSPFLPEEAPHKLREDMEEFNVMKGRFVKWEDMISPLVLLLALLSILFSYPQYEGNIDNEFFELIIKATIFGLVLWSITLIVDMVAKVLRKKMIIDKISLLIIILLLSLIFIELFHI
jgi:hypothetical protein